MLWKKNTLGKPKMAGYRGPAGSIALLALVETEPNDRLCVDGTLHPVSNEEQTARRFVGWAGLLFIGMHGFSVCVCY